MLDRISHEENIGHLFIVDIKFHNINEKTLFFMRSTLNIWKKQKNGAVWRIYSAFDEYFGEERRKEHN